MHTFVIAEIASAHDGDLVKAINLVSSAAESGVDAVKAEFWSDADALVQRRHAYEFAKHYRQYRLPVEWLPMLKAVCDAKKVEFMCTVYLPQDIATVAPFVSRFKIAGFEIHDAAFFEAHRRFKKPIIASLPADVEKPRSRAYAGVKWLHCVQAYPCPVEAMRLRLIRECGLDGFSDHTGVNRSGFSAVMAGARIVEAHVRSYRTDSGNYDAGPHAFCVEEFSHYVHNIREAEAELGDGARSVQPCEAPMLKYRVVA